MMFSSVERRRRWRMFDVYRGAACVCFYHFNPRYIQSAGSNFIFTYFNFIICQISPLLYLSTDQIFQTRNLTMGQLSLLCLTLVTMMKAVVADTECEPSLENGVVEKMELGVFTFKCKIIDYRWQISNTAHSFRYKDSLKAFEI